MAMATGWTWPWGCPGAPTSPERYKTCLRNPLTESQVVLYNSNLTNLNNVTGNQIGAYFGYSLASCDVNGDGLDDLLIGAPMWTDYSVMDRFETGRVYVVYQDKQHRFRNYDTLTGETHKARFGISVASLGDTNLDGFQGESSLMSGLCITLIW